MEETNLVYDLLKRWNTFKQYTEEELEYAKTICKNNHKLNVLAKRYLENGSTHTMATMLENYSEIIGETFEQEIMKRALQARDEMMKGI